MAGKIDILCIDGVTGVGKTSQIGLYRNLLKTQGIKHKIFELIEVDDPESTKNKLLEISEYLRKNKNSVVLIDGSIATDIADDMANNMLKEDIWAKHQQNLQIYASMNSEFNIFSILLTPVDVTMCKDRLDKKHDIFGEEISEIDNITHLKRTSEMLRNFDNSVLTTNTSFSNIDIERQDSMLEIHKKIIEITKKT